MANSNPSSSLPVNIGLLAASQLHVGGVEGHILSLITRSDRSKYRFVILAQTSDQFAQKAMQAGSEVVTWTARSRFDFLAALRLFKLLRKQRVIVLHIHDARSGVIGRLVAKSLNIPVVYTVHLPPYRYVLGHGLCARLKRTLYRQVEKLLNYHFTERIIYVSSSAYHEAVALKLTPKARTKVIEIGVDFKAYTNHTDTSLVRQALNTPVDKPVVCFVGRLTAQKGCDVLLRAICEMAEHTTGFKVWMVGDGPLYSPLKMEARKLGLKSVVDFLGFRDDVPDLLAASDIFVLPSRYEAMPVAILEAMAAGKPCVATDVGDNAHLVEDGVDGFIVPSDNASALAYAVQRLLHNPQLRVLMGQSARRKASRYSVETMVKSTFAIYADAIEAKRKDSVSNRI